MGCRGHYLRERTWIPRAPLQVAGAVASSVHGTCASVPVARGRGCGATQRAAHVIPRRARRVGFCACVVQKIPLHGAVRVPPPGPIGLLWGHRRVADGLPGRHRWADCVATALPFARARQRSWWPIGGGEQRRATPGTALGSPPHQAIHARRAPLYCTVVGDQQRHGGAPTQPTLK